MTCASCLSALRLLAALSGVVCDKKHPAVGLIGQSKCSRELRKEIYECHAACIPQHFGSNGFTWFDNVASILMAFNQRSPNHADICHADVNAHKPNNAIVVLCSHRDSVNLHMHAVQMINRGLVDHIYNAPLDLQNNMPSNRTEASVRPTNTF